DSISLWRSGSAARATARRARRRAADGGGGKRMLYSKHAAKRPLSTRRAGCAMSLISGGPRGGPKGPAVRSRGVGTRLLVTAIVAALGAWLAWASIVRVEPGERVLRRTAVAGAAIRLAPGRHLVVPLLQHLVRVPEGTIRAAASVKARSKEGIDLEIPFEVSFQIDDAGLAAFLGRGGPGGTPQDAARLAASELVSKWGAGAATEALVLGQG